MTKQVEKYIKENLPYYKSVPHKYRYSGVKDKSWSLLSDYVRCRDYILFKGKCVATGRKIDHWREGDPGHYVSMAGHGVESGFDPMNIHLQSKSSNGWGGNADGHLFGLELDRRYGSGTAKKLRQTRPLVKDDDWYHLRKIEDIWSKFQALKKEHPDFDYPPYLK